MYIKELRLILQEFLANVNLKLQYNKLVTSIEQILVKNDSLHCAQYVSKFWKSDSLSPFVIWSLDENPSDGQVEEKQETQAFIMVPPA